MTKKLLDQARDRLRSMYYSYRTEETYIDWMRRYILFHQNALLTLEVGKNVATISAPLDSSVL